MPSKPNGGPAFPANDTYRGMTLRDYFAAQAMHAFLTAGGFESQDEVIARASYRVADLMLEKKGVA